MNNYANIYNCYLFSTGKFYPSPPYVIYRNDLPPGGFVSLYSIPEETAHSIVETGTTRGFKGTVWSERLWVDTDNEAASKAVIDKVKELKYDYQLYTSGGRGFHVGILRNTTPSHLLPLFDKKWTEKTFEGHDSSIYTHLHLFRLPGTVHEKTGYQKKLIEVGGVRAIEADYNTLIGDKGVPNDLIDNMVYTGGGRSIFDVKSIMYNSTPQDNGERHVHLVRCLYALKSQGVLLSHARWWVGEVNKTYLDRKTEENLDQLVKSIYG